MFYVFLKPILLFNNFLILCPFDPTLQNFYAKIYITFISFTGTIVLLLFLNTAFVSPEVFSFFSILVNVFYILFIF